MNVCARNHAEHGAHRVTCLDHEYRAEEYRPGACGGCLPREATVGHLCAACYQRTVDAVVRWAEFAAYVRAAGGRLVAPERGGASPRGYSNLTLSFLSLDECETHLNSRDGRTVDGWVQDPDGARDAIRFAIAAEQAYGSLEVEEREQEIFRERCEHCGTLAVATTRQERGATVVTCAFCGEERARIRPDITRWKGSPTCEHLMHADCDAVDCRCDCHELGTQSRPGGVPALWDADQHTVTSRRRTGRTLHTWREPRDGTWHTHRTRGDIHARHDNYRATWVIQDAHTIEPIGQETAA